jgi:hypothetical protein
MLRIKVLYKNKGHARVGRKVADEIRKRFDATRGSANRYYREIVLLARWDWA